MKKRMGKMETLAEAASMCNAAEITPIFPGEESKLCAKMNQGISYEIPDPGVDFAEIFKGSKFRLISQCYNGDGTYGVVVEADVISNETHEKDGTCRVETKWGTIGKNVILLPLNEKQIDNLK